MTLNDIYSLPALMQGGGTKTATNLHNRKRERMKIMEDEMNWFFEVRYSRNDLWSEIKFNNLDDLRDEVLYRVEKGWEVRKSKKTQELNGKEFKMGEEISRATALRRGIERDLINKGHNIDDARDRAFGGISYLAAEAAMKNAWSISEIERLIKMGEVGLEINHG